MPLEHPYQPKFNYERYGLWVRVSIGWIGQEPGGSLMKRLQGLGILDAELYDINKSDTLQVLNNDLTVFDQVDIKSYLWILGVYELFRMYDQKQKQTPVFENVQVFEIVNKTKQAFSRIRVPLAKLEPSNKFKNTDYAVPKLGANDVQLGWQINAEEIIWYRDLSDMAIKTLNEIRAHRLAKNLRT